MSDQGDRRIVVEIFSHEEAARLRAQMMQMDELHRAEVKRLEDRILGLHKTLYEFMETVGNLRGKR